MKIIYITAFLVLLLSACNVSKNIPAPADAAPVSFRDAASADSNSIAETRWKDFFTDNNLQQLIDSALRKNYDMQVALKNIDAAKLILQQSRLGYLPQASARISASLSRPSDNSLTGLSTGSFLNKSYIEDYTAGVSLSWEADIWGKIKNQKAKAMASYLQSTEAVNLIQTNLVSLLAKGYYDLLMLDAQVNIAKKNLSLNDSTLRIIRLQYDAGQVTALAVQQAEALRLSAAQLIPRLEQDISIQENALSILAGSVPSAISRSTDINKIPVTENASAGIPAKLLENRPDVKIKELQLSIANANTGIAKANMYPALSITAEGGLNSFKASNWFNIPASLFGAVAGSVTQPLFQRKELKTKYELAKIDREKAVIEFRGSVLVAAGEVADALVKNKKLVDQEQVLSARVSTLQLAVKNANLLFKNGMATYLEVITAQSNVLQAELEQAVIKKERLNAQTELYRALGGGWK